MKRSKRAWSRQKCLTCGTVLQSHLGSVIHAIGETKIIINNVPFITCSSCKTKKMSTNFDLMTILRDAYKRGQQQIDYWALMGDD